jgi:ethanolamine utilization protein EutJ
MLAVAVDKLGYAEELLAVFDRCINEGLVREAQGCLQVGVDLGTADIVTAVLDETGCPVAAEMTMAKVVREGVVVNYLGAIEIVRAHVSSLKKKLGHEINRAAAAVPPGTSDGNARVTRNILEAAGLEPVAVVSEPSAAALALGIDTGAVVDIGGGTTGVSILENGKVIYTADEPTGGIHVDLVLAGNFGISTEAAELLKCDSAQQRNLLPVVQPVFEKMAAIVRQHIAGWKVPQVYLVGGTSSFFGLKDVMTAELKLPVYLPSIPIFVTPLGIAMACKG